jgi:hypothetical protein
MMAELADGFIAMPGGQNFFAPLRQLLQRLAAYQPVNLGKWIARDDG